MCDNDKIQKIRNIINKYNKSKEKLIAMLLEIQHEVSNHNYIGEEWASIIAKELNIPLSKVYEVLTFYAMLEAEPNGKYVIEICKSSPCHVNKAEAVAKMFQEVLGIRIGETTSDGLFTLKNVSCIGACDVSPAAKIGNKIYGNLTRSKIEQIIQSYREGLECQK